MSNEERTIIIDVFNFGSNRIEVPSNATVDEVAKRISEYLKDLSIQWRYTDECYLDGGEAWRYNIQIDNVDMKVVDN